MTFEEEFNKIRYWGKEYTANYIVNTKIDKQKVKDAIKKKLFESHVNCTDNWIDHTRT